MNKLYLITGPAGVGKSSVSSKLAHLINKSVLIEGDDIYHIVKGGYQSPWSSNNHLEFFWKNIFDIINNSLQYEYDVIYNYIITKDQLSKIKKLFPKTEIKFVCLMANEDVLLSRDKTRIIQKQVGNRSIELLKELQNENFNNKNILDTTNLTINEIVNLILSNDEYII